LINRVANILKCLSYYAVNLILDELIVRYLLLVQLKGSRQFSRINSLN